MTARALMFQGTGSSVGKSVLVAGLARALVRRGLRVLPFKPQNMSNNAAVTRDGGEIGRAQALQAQACGVAPSVHMNPVLLKPQSEVGAQIVVQGKVIGNARARAYQEMKAALLPRVLESFDHLRAGADIVLVEGAGSASEINLRRNDIANMGLARAASVPVVLIGDIDRGGVIASLVGTHTVLEPEDADLVCGFIVNRMRGDTTLFDAGMRIIADRTGWPALGLVPYLPALRALPAEDAAEIDDLAHAPRVGARLQIVVPHLPWIANFDDLDPLRAESDVAVTFAPPGRPLPRDCDLIILPGSKATIADLAVLRTEGWDIDIAAHVRAGGKLLGICGGFQMLGQVVADPDGIEGPPQSASGLGLLEVETVLTGNKQLRRATGVLASTSARFEAYEMHVGRTVGAATARPMALFDDGRTDGAVSADGRVCGTYLHGLFLADTARRAFLDAFGATSAAPNHAASVEAALDALAAHLEAHVDVGRLLSLAR
jgi:adenosylcobyric acid synthase